MKQRPIILLLCSLILLAGVQPIFAAAPGETAAIQLTVQPFFENHYRAGRWLPLGVTLTNSGSNVTARVGVHTDATYETVLELPGGAKKSAVLYIRPLGAFQLKETVQVSVDGVEVASVEVPLKAVSASRALFGVLSEQPLTLALPGDDQAFKQIDSLRLKTADLPERGEGLSMFDVLVVDGAPLAELSAPQQQALTNWVRMGGQLVVGGSKLEQVLSQLPEPLRPARPGPVAAPQRLTLLPELAADAPASTTLIAAEGAVVVARAEDQPIAVQRELGSGQVTLLGFSLSAPELAALPPQSSFWSQIVALPSASGQPNGMQSPDQVRAQQFGMALMTLPVLAMPPLGVLAGLLAAYVLVIGPGLYLVLRRLDRQAWGWVAIPAVTLVFSLGAYGYGLRLRGNDLILNQLTVVTPGAGHTRVQSYAGLFSPRSAAYDIQSSSDALFQPLPNVNFEGMQTPGGDVNFVQGSAGVRALNVTQWSMSSFIAEQMIDGAPLAAELTLSGSLLHGTVRNTGQAPVRDTMLFYQTRTVDVGDLAPGESRPLQMDLGAPAPQLWDGPLSMLLLRNKWDFSKPIQPPTDVRMQQMVLDGLIGSALEAPSEPMVIGWLDQAPIRLTIERSRVQHQQHTIVALPVSVGYDPGVPLNLPSGWIKPGFESSSAASGPCITQFGSGWYMDSGSVTSRLQIPPAARALPVAQATVQVQVDGPQSRLKLDLYDWVAGQWQTQPEGQMTLTLDDPARYLSETGTLLLRIELQDEQGKGSGCISPTLTIQGAQP